jgi:glucose/arabinose dehydrogenase
MLPALALVETAGCQGGSGADQREFDTSAGRVRLTTVAAGLEHPWSVAFLPEGGMLVTERPGRLRLISNDGRVGSPIAGVPGVFASGQGGLLEVALDPGFGANRMVYLSYAEPGEGGAGTAVARGRLGEGRLEELSVIFRQQPKVEGGNHFGSRLVFAPDGMLFVTLGERNQRDRAQSLADHLGTVVRIAPDGTVPKDNPFIGRAGALPEIWSYGHRNVQGAALHPETGQLWTVEHGPRGGDEVNVLAAGRNYGWPVIGYGRHYNLTKIGEGFQGGHGAAGHLLGPLHCHERDGVLHRDRDARVAREPVRRGTGGAAGEATRAQRGAGGRGGAAVPGIRPAHQGRTPGAGRQTVSADRRAQRGAGQGGSGVAVTANLSP